MRSALHALIWDNLRYAGLTQIGMLACCMLLPLGMYAMITPIVPAAGPGSPGVTPGDPISVLLEVSMQPFVMFVVLMGAATGYAQMPQLYTKPLSNLSIAAWRMIGGSILIAIQIGLIVALHNGLYNAGWPLTGAILFTIAAWFASQPFFCLAGKTILGTLVTMIPVGLMCVWFITRYKPLGGGQRDWNEITLSETLQLLAVIGVFAWCTVQCVGLARRGDGLPGVQGIGEWFCKLFNWELSRSGRRKPFRSPQAAMFWYEWRWKGWALSASMLVLLAIFVPAQLYQSASLQSYYDAVCGAYLGTMLPAMFMGVINGFQLESIQISLASGRPTQLSEIDELGSFQAIRPVSDDVLSRSNLWVCLASIGLMTGLWLMFAGPAVLWAISQGQLEQLFVQHKLFLVPLVGVFMWIGMSNVTALTSSGRTKTLGIGLIGLCVAFVGLLCVLQWIGNEQLEQRVLQLLAAIFVLALIAFVGWSYARAMRMGFVSRGGAAMVLCVAAVIMIVGCWLLPQINVSGIVGVLCAAILCVLPWATTPLATHWNRHR